MSDVPPIDTVTALTTKEIRQTNTMLTIFILIHQSISKKTILALFPTHGCQTTYHFFRCSAKGNKSLSLSL